MKLGPAAIVMLWLLSCSATRGNGAEPVDFSRDVRPILENFCWKCHGPEKQKGGLLLDSRESALLGGDSGEKALVPGQADQSSLISRVESTDPDIRMPANAEPLSSEQIKTLRAWITQGASWPESTDAPTPVRRNHAITDEDRQHWSYRPLRAVEPSAVKDATWCRTTIDRFVLAALEAKGMRPNPDADRGRLIRRVYFDLVGLPPPPDAVEAFVADASPRAYEDLVDRLLDSPQYGERWGRHWLDLARFADSDGLETDADRPNAYHYRDFVIRALNDDLSYQTFVRWQLAGDEYEPDNPQAICATGFLTAAPNQVLNVPMEDEKLRLRYNELDDMAATTAAALLGLTLGCARCHDHKFDAIPTSDYYRIQCAFMTTARAEVFLATRADAAKYREQEGQWDARLKTAESKLNSWLADQRKPLIGALRQTKIDSLSISADDKKLLKEQPESDAAKKIAKQHEKALQLSDDDYRRAMNDEQRRQWDVLQSDIKSLQRAEPQRPPKALAITEAKDKPESTWLLDRGDFHSKKSLVDLGFLSVLTGSRTASDYWAAARRGNTSGQSTMQRHALADWITNVEHGAGPLLARVMVNRVWQHHFGEGLTRTLSDFGVRGQRPSHPELLEWLAHQFVSDSWRLKPLHRLMMTSAAYRQDTTFDEGRSKLDPDNRLLWRRRPQRLEAEILRDAMLSVSGALNAEQFGPAFKPPIPPEAIVARNTKDPYPQDAKETAATRRRSVYMFHKRVVQHPLLQAFDGPDAAVTCSRRSNTTVAPQALALLNDRFVRDRATDFARRLTSDGSIEPSQSVERAFRLALSRPPSEIERAESLKFLSGQLERRAARQNAPSEEVRLQALADLCQTLFGLNEFIYID